MADEKKSTNGGIGVLGLLGVVFVTLKLTGHIDWSWWYVTLPFWWWLPVLALAGLALLAAYLVVSAMEALSNTNKRK